MKKGILHRINEDLLNMELDLSGPKDHPVAENENVVGVLEDESTRREYVLSRAYSAKGLEAVSRAREYAEQRDSEGYKAAIKEAGDYATLAQMTDDMFWQDLRDAFGLQDKDTVGLRDGWQVVWYDEPRSIIEIVMISSR